MLAGSLQALMGHPQGQPRACDLFQVKLAGSQEPLPRIQVEKCVENSQVSIDDRAVRLNGPSQFLRRRQARSGQTAERERIMLLVDL